MSSIKKVHEIFKVIITITFIALLMFGVFIPLLPTNNNHPVRASNNNDSCHRIPAYLQPYSSQITPRINPDTYKPITQFPEYFNRNMYPGKILGVNGTLCVLPKSDQPMPIFEDCDLASAYFLVLTKDNLPSVYKSYTTDPKITKGKGGGVDSSKFPHLATSIKRVFIGMDERKIIAFNDARLFVEKDVLNFTHFLLMNSSTLVNTIKKTNWLVTNYISDTPGELRNQVSMLLHDNVKIDRKGLRNLFYQQGGVLEDLHHFHSLYDKLEKYDLVDKALKHLNADELRVLKMLGHLTPAPKEIDCKLNFLAGQMLELAVKIKNREIQPIAAAAYVLQGINSIHPFMFGNGRTARIWMNAILQLGGFKAVVIPDNVDYSMEVVKDCKSPGSFAAYLGKVILWNRMQPNLRHSITSKAGSSQL